jgi:hypothetical protein
MRKELYFCDQCKQEVERGNLTEVKLELDPCTSYKTKKFNSVSKYYEICESCAEKLGFTKTKQEQGQTIVEPTTSDKLYDIIAQMIAEAHT